MEKSEKDVLPEAVTESKTKPDTVFFRVVIKKDVYDRLKDVSRSYSTGQGSWDFGVTIQILLDYFEESKRALDSEKLDAILLYLEEGFKPVEKEVEEPKKTVFLGGTEEVIR